MKCQLIILAVVAVCMSAKAQGNCAYHIAGDLNSDCKVDLSDLAVLANNWLIDCNVDSEDPACIHYEECLPGLLQCSVGEYCNAGYCVCATGLSKCSNGCYDLATDERHCGSCGTPCANGERCINGSCVLLCQPGLSNCGGQCVNQMTDESHCGGCGHMCPSGYRCINGSCMVSCQAGLTDCAGQCVNTYYDPNHCGMCGSICDSNEYCDYGVCLPK